MSFKTYNNTITGKNFGNQVTLCPHLDVAISSTRRRRCAAALTTVTYCNSGNAASTTTKVYVKLPEYVVLVKANKAYTLDKDKNYVFDVGMLDPNQCSSIQITDSVVCNNPDIRGLTQCTKTWITPVNRCTPPSEQWDRSDIMLQAKCGENGRVRLGIYNTGTGSMADSSEFRILLDAQVALRKRFKLAAGDSLILKVPANGQTVRLEADQRPFHPVKQSTNITLEACGINAEGTVSLGYVAQLPCDDPEPEVAMECLPITDSYDPNDKLVLPVGITAEHYTPTGTALQYKIRFQNTGNDYAYRVVVTDTLSDLLDISTLQMGSVSHPYTFTVSGKGRPVLTFTFNNINLPDSTRDQLGSNGYIQFLIRPKENLPAKTRIENLADIFFDYNPSVRTNTVFNTIYDVPPVESPAAKLEYASVIAAPIITTFTPATGLAGTAVSITGINFSITPQANTVTFNGVKAVVTNAAANTITVTVPSGEVTGRIKVVTPDGSALSAFDFTLAPTAAEKLALEQALSVYPNPTPGRFVIRFATPTRQVQEIAVFDALGRSLVVNQVGGKTIEKQEINLTGYGAGMYLVRIRTRNGDLIQKIVVR